ncbi:methionine adenosyltransferase [Bacteroidota bacterium]
MSYLFTSESVSEGHPDKVADQISDALLDGFLQKDPESKVAIETLVNTGLVVLAGEVRTNCYVDVQKITRKVINDIGYTKSDYKFDGDSCAVISSIEEQSPDIFQGVNRGNVEDQGAGDQGMMFGYATSETDNYMPLALDIAHKLLIELSQLRREGKVMTYLRPDSKSQVTVEYDENHKPVKVHTIVISTQHDDFDEEKKMLAKIKADVANILIPGLIKKLPEKLHHLFNKNFILHVNPTGKFVIGGPHGDTGLTGRKIIVDTYGGRGAHGGGAFSGKDSSKVDRSAAYAARHIAKNLVAAGVANKILVQLAYAIGVAQPVGIFVDTYGTSNVNITDSEIANKIKTIFDLRPGVFIERLGLKYPVFLPTASYGHMGRDPYQEEIELEINGKAEKKSVWFFSWEKLDYVEKVKAAFGI